MPIRIVFSDIDGTFLTNDHRVTEHTQQAVKELLAKDIPFVLVSARMPEAIYPITRNIGVTIPIISYSGGLVLTAEEQVLYSKALTEADCRRVLADIDEHWPEVTVNYYAGRHWYVRCIDSRVQLEMDITSAQAEIADFASLMAEGVLPNKILIMADPPVCEEMEKKLGERFPELNVVRSAPMLLEIMDRSVSKATGIEVMLKHFGLTAEEVIAFGDNYNDTEMLQYVGCGVAMGNAPEPIRALAHEVTKTNEEDGIHACLLKKGLVSA